MSLVYRHLAQTDELNPTLAIALTWFVERGQLLCLDDPRCRQDGAVGAVVDEVHLGEEEEVKNVLASWHIPVADS